MARSNRRAFLLDAGRGVAALGLSAAAFVLAARRPKRPTEAPCVNQGVCRRCPVLGACGLPAALSTRTALGRSE
ncbi:MAG: hypothetical protein CMJ18_13245 [Phycisphaeraceae bacterium]|nr:hypothetical protein [Phycisphaeraceae bacterium]